jgi:hypothetical protein
MDMPEVLLKWYRILYQRTSDTGGPARRECGDRIIAPVSARI